PTGYCGGPAMGCSQPRSVWRLVTIHDVTKGRLTGGRYQDAIAIGAGSVVRGLTAGGLVRVLFGSDTDLTKLDSLPAAVRNAAQVDLFARPLPVEPSGPSSAEVADFNADGVDDLAVLFTGTEEVRLWLGGRNKGPGEIEGRVALNKCGMACTGDQRCLPHPKFTVADLDHDGRSEVFVICVPETGLSPRLIGFKPTGEAR
ncbi:MAG: VCBS repeat-containing protein, partial [Deltaproteobacteria bacterium]|nr:VCBS repeat-containing protein [Deltaproteobacteria bacterium]